MQLLYFVYIKDKCLPVPSAVCQTKECKIQGNTFSFCLLHTDKETI